MQGEHQERVGVWAVAEKLLWPLKAGLLPDTPPVCRCVLACPHIALRWPNRLFPEPIKTVFGARLKSSHNHFLQKSYRLETDLNG